MSTLREIKRHIQSVEKVEQITKAMEMVAVARLHRAQVKAEQSHRYASKLQLILDSLSSSSEEVNHPFFIQRQVKRTGLFIVAGDRGLCGSYNSNIFSVADEFLENYALENVELILAGQKAINYYQNKKWTIRHTIQNWGGKIKLPEINGLSSQLVNWYLSGDFDEIWIVYTHFKSVLLRKTVVEKFLSIAKPKVHKKEGEYIFEPDVTEIYQELLPRYCMSKIYTVFDESYASELASRALSMHKAAHNAKDLIEKLTLLRNKVRQTGITKEMVEIASGAEVVR